MYKILILFILMSCQKEAKKVVFESVYPDELSTEETKVCKQYWQESLKLPELKQKHCIEQNELGYFSQRFTKKVEELCPLYSFEAFIMSQARIEECINHILQPKFKVGNKVKINNNEFDANCYGIIVKHEYKNNFNLISNDLFNKIYILDVYCNNNKILDSKSEPYFEKEENISLF